jgi:iron complex transport system ATP-binding protein
MIEVESLDISYDGLKTILHQITFEVEKGTFFGVIGPNGSGKTTLLKTLSRVLQTENGVIYIGKRELATFSSRELAREIGVVPQDSDIHFDFTVRDIIMMGRHPYVERFSSETLEDLDIVRHAMAVTNTEKFAERSIKEISGGERQRVIIARALAQEPRVLLLDEPTSHLDISHQMEILNIIRNLKGEVTIVAVFHDLNLAADYCDRLILMKEGRIASIGTPAEVLNREHLKMVFDINAVVKQNPSTGKPHIVPLPKNGDFPPRSMKIHIICGGGTGSNLMYTLKERGYSLTTGVLCINDSDYMTTTDLDIPCITEPPFSEISKSSLQKLQSWLDEADVILLVDMLIGKGNIENIRMLRKYKDKHVILFGIKENFSETKDFTEGEGEQIIKFIRQSGAIPVISPDELFQILDGWERACP